MAIESPQPGLFDAHSPTESVYFLTNRNNLLRILAAGMVMPEAGFATKYYDDLLRLAPGRLPLIASAVSADLISMVTPEPQAFPVMLELRRASLRDDGFPALMRNGSHDKAGWANPDALMWAPSGALPFVDTVTAVHFRTDAEREEFEVRDFADARPRTDLHRATPSLFDGDGPSADSVTEWLRSLEAPGGPSREDVTAEDRRSGAVLLGSGTAMATEEELHGWGELLVGKKAGRQAGNAVGRISRALHRAARARDIEDNTLQICIEELAATNRLEVWRPLDILGAIREKLGAQLKGKMDPMIPALDRAAAILRDDEVFEGFRVGGSPTLKALLMALRRPEPGRLLGWDPGGPGSTPEVLNLAAVLVGGLTGRAMIPVEHRKESLDDALARVEADRLSTSSDRAMPPLKAARVAVKRADDSLTLAIGGETVINLPTPRPIEQPIQIDNALLEDPAVRARALEIAMRNGWDDAVESIVMARTAELHTSVPPEAGSAITIRFSGIGALRHELLDEAFLAHVDQGGLAREEQEQLSAVTQTSPTSHPDSAR